MPVLEAELKTFTIRKYEIVSLSMYKAKQRVFHQKGYYKKTSDKSEMREFSDALPNA